MSAVEPPKIPYDQQVARYSAPYLARARITPNQVTAFSVLLTLFSAWLFAIGERDAMAWAAGLFVLGRFLDHFDGELARHTQKSSRFGYYFDYVAGALSYAALFIGLGIGFAGSSLGGWSMGLGLAGAAASLISLGLNVDLDRTTGLEDGDAIGYPSAGGFELEDGIYLLAPVTWLGFLLPFFVLAGIGACVYCLWTAWQLWAIKARAKSRLDKTPPTQSP
ncbi:MAG: CDP-alcohol phosphatidyltransferase family protein [Pseudomonadota bacterium]